MQLAYRLLTAAATGVDCGAVSDRMPHLWAEPQPSEVLAADGVLEQICTAVVPVLNQETHLLQESSLRQHQTIRPAMHE